MIFFFISLVTYISFLILKGRKALMELNKNKSNLKKYKQYIFAKKNYLNFELLGLILIVLTFFFDIKTVGICTIILYMILSLLEIKKITTKFKFKKSYLKIIITTLVIYLVIFILLGIDYNSTKNSFLGYNRIALYYPIVVTVGYLLYPIIYFSAFITKTKNKE